MVIETQAARLHEQEATIQELRQMVAELRSLKANLEETLEELHRQIFGIKSSGNDVEIMVSFSCRRQ